MVDSKENDKFDLGVKELMFFFLFISFLLVNVTILNGKFSFWSLLGVEGSMQCIHIHNCKYNYCTVQKQASPLIPHPSFFLTHQLFWSLLFTSLVLDAKCLVIWNTCYKLNYDLHLTGKEVIYKNPVTI